VGCGYEWSQDFLVAAMDTVKNADGQPGIIQAEIVK
jgi:hypothetical protein